MPGTLLGQWRKGELERKGQGLVQLIRHVLYA